jgi:Dyp-type peroxidase family
MQNLYKLINIDNTNWKSILKNMQGNIVKHHGREHAYHIFLQFDASKKTAIKTWLKDLKDNITDGLTQLTDTERYKSLVKKKELTEQEEVELKSLKNKWLQFFFISSEGYKALGIDSSVLNDQAFQNGMQSRKDLLQDPEVKDWNLLTGTRETIHAMLIIASDHLQSLQQQFNKVDTGLLAKGIKIIHIQKGRVLRNEHGLGIEHFGYVDGISQPIFMEANDIGAEWNDYADIKDMALVSDVESESNAFGSYFVFRKLEQNVKAFKEAEKNLGLGEIGGAYLVGRFEDGTPVAKYAAEKGIKSEEELENDFNYKNDSEGSKCPFHSHIRITNPRDNKIQAKKPIRIVRRGIPYDDAGRGNNLAWEPEKKVGLLFMCYAKSITSQFEVIQADWANNGDVFGENIAIDGVIGQGRKNIPLQEYPLKWGEKARVSKCNFSGFVTMQGGEYFFAPSISFLKSI